ncbi:hypothetical protein K3495_g7201 [Podosphaera aphanis]|nr:hypothetical protein K3495_g7201 [Podosphaera aphanis]
MSFPKPAHHLDDSCSIIHKGTLFSYTKTAFQALPLRKGAKWLELPMGVSVQGGVCVKVVPINNPDATALFIVGGQTNSSDYQGLQRYRFENGYWETIIPSDPVTQNRLYHSSVYLDSSNSILVFSGSQDGNKQFSTQTFTIQASEPFRVLSHQSMAPPAISPMLLPWSDGQAAYLGGSISNQKVMIFDPAISWYDSNVTLANPIHNTDAVKSVIITGDDASKALYTFDLTVTPNEVNRTILVDAGGKPVQNARPIAAEDDKQPEEGMSLGLTVATWPAYNGSLAPTSTRTSYALSQDESGLVIISGGSETDSICLFKARENTWEEATELLGTSSIPGTGNTANTDTTGSVGNAGSTGKTGNTGTANNVFASTSTPATDILTKSTGTAEASRDSTSTASTGPFPTKIIGAALGSIAISALITILFLIFCKWRRRRKQYNANNGKKPNDMEEKDGMDFMDKDDPSMLSVKPSASVDSLSPIYSPAPTRKGTKKSNRLSYQSYKSAISKPIVIDTLADKGPQYFEHPGPVPQRGEEKNDTRRSSGWNRYWSGGSKANGPTGLRLDGPKSNTARSSDYSEESDLQRPNIGERADIYNVALGSPTFAYQPQHHALRGEIGGNRASVDSTGSRYSGGYDQKRWTPIEKQGWAQNNQGYYSNSAKKNARAVD